MQPKQIADVLGDGGRPRVPLAWAIAGRERLRREGKAAVLEQRLVEASTGRAVARAWVVQLLVQNGKVVEWPDSYFARIAAIEGREIPVGPRRPAEVWGPPER